MRAGYFGGTGGKEQVQSKMEEYSQSKNRGLSIESSPITREHSQDLPECPSNDPPHGEKEVFLSAMSKQTEGVFINVTNIAIELKQSICSALERQHQMGGYQDKAGVMPKGPRVRCGVTPQGGWALA